MLRKSVARRGSLTPPAEAQLQLSEGWLFVGVMSLSLPASYFLSQIKLKPPARDAELALSPFSPSSDSSPKLCNYLLKWRTWQLLPKAPCCIQASFSPREESLTTELPFGVLATRWLPLLRSKGHCPSPGAT